MHVLLALGSRGDVQPMAVLARGLAEAGRDVAFIGLAEYESLVATLAPGARFVGIPTALEDAMDRSRGLELYTRSLIGQAALLRRWVGQMAGPVADALLAMVQPGDTVVAGALARGAALACAAGIGCEMATVVFTGQLPTLQRESYFAPNYLTGWAWADRIGTRISWTTSTSLGAALTEAVRRRLGLPRASSWRLTELADRHRILVAASLLLVPPAPDWPTSARQIGYLAPPPTPFEPSSELEGFLNREPVFIGFGSFTTFTQPRDVEAIGEAARRTGRAIITPIPPGFTLGMVAPNVLAIEPTPHDWLFPRVAATIHHGGSGTSHEALRSGRPSAVVPFGVDQPYHGARIHALGLGPEPGKLQRGHLSVDELTRLIDGLTGAGAARHRERAAAAAVEARAEEGPGTAIAALR